MYRLISFSVFLFMTRIDCRSQTVEYLHGQIPVMDSLTTALDNDPGYRVYNMQSGQAGDSVCNLGSYQGIVYYNNKLHEISKLKIHPTFRKEIITIYCMKDSILKISIDKTSYYRIGKHFYDRSGEEVINPEMITKLDNFGSILKLAFVNFSNN